MLTLARRAVRQLSVPLMMWDETSSQRLPPVLVIGRLTDFRARPHAVADAGQAIVNDDLSTGIWTCGAILANWPSKTDY